MRSFHSNVSHMSALPQLDTNGYAPYKRHEIFVIQHRDEVVSQVARQLRGHRLLEKRIGHDDWDGDGDGRDFHWTIADAVSAPSNVFGRNT